ncbi:MAG: hypothetical protein R3C26_26210 [Calditrichia bacterium]
MMDLMKARAAQCGIEGADSRCQKMELATELAAMDELIREKVDVLIVTPIVIAVYRKSEQHLQTFRSFWKPIRCRELTTMVAICDYDAGVKAGKFAGHYAKSYLGGVAKVLDIALPTTLRPVPPTERIFRRVEIDHPGCGTGRTRQRRDDGGYFRKSR